MSQLHDRRAIGDILVDGVLKPADEASVSVLDIGMQRGFGCFEALRSYAGKPFRSRAHCDRLAASADKLGLPVPEVDLLEMWIADRSAAGGDCTIRVFLTGGLDPAHPGTGSTVIVYAEPLPEPKASLRLLPVNAPWHPDGVPSELTGAKTLSYGPNLAASLSAQRAGFDDALLVGRSGFVLEGPTYGIAWITGGVLETPSLELGILASITRVVMLEVTAGIGFMPSEGSYPLDRLLGADEVFALSTLKEFTPVVAVGDRTFEPGPVTARFVAAFADIVAEELAAA